MHHIYGTLGSVVNIDFGLELGRPEVTLRTRSVTGSVTLIPAALPLSASRDSETLQVRRVLLLIVLYCDLCSCMFTLSHYIGAVRLVKRCYEILSI